MFFKEEINIYHQMFSRESQKSNSGLNVLNDFVSHSPSKNGASSSQSKNIVQFYFVALLRNELGAQNSWVCIKFHKCSRDPAIDSTAINFCRNFANIQRERGNVGVIGRWTNFQWSGGKLTECRMFVASQRLACRSTIISSWQHIYRHRFIHFECRIKAMLRQRYDKVSKNVQYTKIVHIPTLNIVPFLFPCEKTRERWF